MLITVFIFKMKDIVQHMCNKLFLVLNEGLNYRTKSIASDKIKKKR